MPCPKTGHTFIVVLFTVYSFYENPVRFQMHFNHIPYFESEDFQIFPGDLDQRVRFRVFVRIELIIDFPQFWISMLLHAASPVSAWRPFLPTADKETRIRSPYTNIRGADRRRKLESLSVLLWPGRSILRSLFDPSWFQSELSLVSCPL